MTEPVYASGRETRMWALLIGIDEYPRLGPAQQLSGCVNDVDAIEALLTSEQFRCPGRNVLKLTSPAADPARLATRDNIIRAFRSHLMENERIGSDDTVVVYYSGHGSQVPDEEGDEEDGYDETIVPCDGGPDRSRRAEVRDITDDELSRLLEEVAERTHNINLFFDSCHSGTITRAAPAPVYESAQGRARFLPAATYEVAPPPRPSAGNRSRSMGPSDWLPLSDGYVLISACRADERARETNFDGVSDGNVHGVLTYCLLGALSEVGPQTTYYDLWTDLRLRVRKLSPYQNPQLEGAFERTVLGGAALPRRRYVEVSAKDEGGVTLAAGAVHGATVGSRFAVYPRGTHEFSDAAARAAVVVLGEVGSFRSSATVREGSLESLAVGAPAIEIEHDYSSTRMVVEVCGDATALGSVRRLVGESPLLSLASDAGQSPTARVVLSDPANLEAWPGEARGPRLCILSSVDERPLVSPVAAEEAAAVIYKLEHIAKYHNVLSIRNADPGSRLKGLVRLHLLKVAGVDDQGRELLAPAERNAGGDIILKMGERVVLEIENLSDIVLHAAVIDCDTQWGVRPIFPPPGAPDDSVPAGFRRRTNRFKVSLPEHQQGDPNTGPLPCETVKLFVTTETVDFRSVWQPETRDRGCVGEREEPRSSLYRMMKFAVGGDSKYARRSLVADADSLVEDWTTDELLFHIVS